MKKSTKASILSFLIPGLGQVYNGQVLKGIFIFVLSPTIIAWIFGVFDAHKVASGEHYDFRILKAFLIACLVLSVVSVAFYRSNKPTKSVVEPKNVIGLYAFNKTNGVFIGQIVSVGPCKTEPSIDCYELYLGPNYKNVLHPVDTSVIKDQKPFTPPDWYSYDDWNMW